MRAEDWTALGTCGTAILALVAIGIAWWQVHEAKRLREEQAMPQVVASMESNPNSFQHVELVVKNYGKTVARDVRITASPVIRRTDGHGGVEPVWLPDEIPILAPGQSWRTLLDVATTRRTVPELWDEERHEVVVSFKGLHRKPHHTRSVLDWGAYKGAQVIRVETVHHIAKRLGELSKSIDKLTAYATARGRALNVWMRDGAQEDRRLDAQETEAKAHAEELSALLMPKEDPAEPEAPTNRTPFKHRLKGRRPRRDAAPASAREWLSWRLAALLRRE